MKVKQGYIVTVADIGTQGTVVRVGENDRVAVVEFEHAVDQRMTDEEYRKIELV